MKTLVVDDERDIKTLFQQRFRHEIKAGQIEFHFVFSAEDALDYVRHLEAPNDLWILSDINMPGMSGLELLQILKSTYPQFKFFLITAYGDDQKYQLARELGADDYMTKPLDFSLLKQKLFNP